MLTVKHIEPSGHESIHPAVRVSFQPRAQLEDKSWAAQCVFIDTPKMETIALGSWGAIYVMNDAGKTVAKYDLGGWETPPKHCSS